MGKEKVLLKSEEKMSKLEAAKLMRDIADACAACEEGETP